jgi:enamine deaminase RidA (YjgF/YER057c/UK114 family)
MAFETINPEAFGARPSGWSHGMLAEKGGRILFVAGQIAPVGDFVAQWGGALGRVMEVVRSAGGRPDNVGRMVVYITDRPAYLANLTPLGEVHRKHMGRHYPAMAVVEVKSLIDSKALVEIEAVAIL